MVLATCMLNENILVTAMIPHIKHNLFEFLYRLLSGLSYREITHIIKFMKQYKNWIIEITLNHAIKVSKYSESKLGIIKKRNFKSQPSQNQYASSYTQNPRLNHAILWYANPFKNGKMSQISSQIHIFSYHFFTIVHQFTQLFTQHVEQQKI